MEVDVGIPMGPRRRANARKSDRKSFRLGAGEFEDPSQPPMEVSLPVIRGEGSAMRITVDRRERASVQRGRKLFFAACGQVRPEFVEDLNAAPKAALQALDQPTAEPVLVSALLGERRGLVGKLGLVDKLRYADNPWYLVELDDRYRELREALEAWATRFNLRDEWLMDLVSDYLCPPPWNEQLLSFFPLVKTDRRLSLISWDPTAEPREQARARLSALIEQHLDESEKQAATRGLVRTPERRQLRQFYWLAGYQICGWSKNRIAEAADKDRAGVGRAIRNLAGFLSLTLRPAKVNDPTQTAETIAAVLRRIPFPT